MVRHDSDVNYMFIPQTTFLNCQDMRQVEIHPLQNEAVRIPLLQLN